jgi:radical SAM protein with 4Fe4S-binding SPASM domain
MDLIIKPTERCNFSCTFCSSTNISEDKAALLPHNKISRFLDRYPDTKTIIVNGGDPLVISPDYYWKILALIEERGMSTTLSFTTNLWAFYKNPEMWAPLFRHPLVGVGTSFNYGTTRRITKDMILTEDIFWRISNKFQELVGYRPDFISVITEENYDTAMDNVYLAKEMGVQAKVNYALGSGKLSKPFLKYKIYKFYLDVIDESLERYEYNTSQLLRKSKDQSTTCPLNRSCDESIRCLQPEGDYYSCGAFGDDREFAIDFEAEMQGAKKFLPLQSDLEIQMLKNECLTCPLFDICNGCKKNISDLKRSNLVDDHCSGMQSLLPRLQKVIQLK